MFHRLSGRNRIQLPVCLPPAARPFACMEPSGMGWLTVPVFQGQRGFPRIEDI